MKLRQIQFVVAIAQTGSIRGAANACNATQPTLSTALSQLEEELGAKLFERTTRMIKLTPFGHHLLPFLQSMLDTQAEVHSEARAFLDPVQKVLRVGLSPLVDMHMIKLVTEPHLRQNEGVEVFFKECLLDDVQSRLMSGAIDFAILPRDIIPEGMSTQRFYSDRLFYIAQQDDAPPVGSPVFLNRLPDAPIIMTGGGCGLNKSIENLTQQEGVNITVYPGHALSYQVIQEWAWLGIGAGILPEAKLVDGSGLVSPLMLNNGQPANLDLFWVWREENSKIEHVGRFLDHLQQRVPKIINGQTRLAAV